VRSQIHKYLEAAYRRRPRYTAVAIGRLVFGDDCRRSEQRRRAAGAQDARRTCHYTLVRAGSLCVHVCPHNGVRCVQDNILIQLTTTTPEQQGDAPAVDGGADKPAATEDTDPILIVHPNYVVD